MVPRRGQRCALVRAADLANEDIEVLRQEDEIMPNCRIWSNCAVLPYKALSLFLAPAALLEAGGENDGYLKRLRR